MTKLSANMIEGTPLLGYLYGLTLSTAGSSATWAVTTGAAADSTGTKILTPATAFTKTTSAWAVGTGNGSLDDGTIGNSLWYHVYLISNPISGVVDYTVSLCPAIDARVFTVTIATPGVVTCADHGLQIGSGFIPTNSGGALPTGMVSGTRYYVISAGFTTGAFQFSATQGGAAINTTGSQSGVHSFTCPPTLPSGYTLYRRIGSMKTTGSAQWQTFLQIGDRFHITSVTDVSIGTQAATLMPLSVPVGVRVIPFGSAHGQTNPSSGGASISTSPGDNSAFPVVAFYIDSSASVSYGRSAWTGPTTNLSARIYVSSSVPAGLSSLDIGGWIDTRGR